MSRDEGSLGLSNRDVDNLAYLSTSGVIARPELQATRAARVAGNDAVGKGGLHVAVEWITLRHIPKSGTTRWRDSPILSKHNYLGNLRPRNVIARPELPATRTAPVPRNDAPLVGGLYIQVEGVGGGHVAKGGCGRGVQGPTFGQHDYLA